jgi:hypothetical protein
MLLIRNHTHRTFGDGSPTANFLVHEMRHFAKHPQHRSKGKIPEKSNGIHTYTRAPTTPKASLLKALTRQPTHFLKIAFQLGSSFKQNKTKL